MAAVVLCLATLAGCSTQPEPLTLVGLGDSYSSGEGTEASTGDCGRSPTAYPALVAAELESRGLLAVERGGFESVACSGAELSDVAEQIDALGGRRFDVVTLTVGGNDAGFLDVLLDCIGADDAVSALIDGDIDRLLERGCTLGGTDIDARLQELDEELRSTYEQIIDEVLTGEGTLIVLGYPHLLEDPAGWDQSEGERCDGLSAEDIAALRQATDALDETIERSSDGLDAVEFIDQRSAFAGHGRCSDDPWLNGITLRPRLLASFHPNEPGHRTSANLVLEAITD